ncbi:HlyD family secretion protein [Pseudomonas aeruginosa]|uniref:HlyD family secretion protein n=1 Tax=Pseudomonas aeruginosa TaxID=287 RepID=UPI002238F839|nr:HlyD family efflux transporter periplasmic adaptor subunit [Pseudomonas aeruginosa]MCW4646457.1 HlyD family efflux transporter periplasmic adaptor subunit [Pseudomonas aeruginosa]
MNIPSLQKNKVVIGLLVAGLIVLAWWAWQSLLDDGPGQGFASGNGRIEATEINIAAKLAGRVSEIYVQEGEFVTSGQVLAKMQIDTLQAQHDEAVAGYQENQHAVAAAQSQVSLKQSEVIVSQAVVTQRQAELDAAKRRLVRSETLSKEGASSQQELDDDRASARSSEAAVVAAQAQVASSQAAVRAAEAEEVGAVARVNAAQATINRILADIEDSNLKAPRDGRVQLRVAEPGEVLAVGGRALNLVDLADVYITFFLPETEAGRVALGSDVRIVLDAAPHMPIPAKVSFVASTAQFTPKSVETQSERQKLMFRVKAQIAPELLRRYPEQVKTGLPGVAWVKLDADTPWPASLTSTPEE